MVIKSSEFVTSAVKPSQYPVEDLPEIAFVGRSNVGKSSLINTLLNRKRLAKTSSTPGRTRLINFFVINETFSFVDLPGYGYAKVPVSVRKSWGPMIETYLLNRNTLKGVVLIMDMRRMPSQKELDIINWFNEFSIPYVLIFTKIDKLSKTKQISQSLAISKVLGTDKNNLVLFSAKSRQGKDVIWQRIESLINN